MSAPVLEVDEVVVAYGRVTVLDHVSVTVDAGQALALLGTNGAGKSTLLKAISGLVPLRDGDVRLRGTSIAGWSTARIVDAGVAQLPGGRATFPGLTVGETLRLGALCVDKADRAARLDEVHDLFDWLAERSDQAAGTLSGGQQQQLALARMLVARPTVLLVDELSLGLAPGVVKGLLELLERRRADGAAVVIVDQQVDQALSFASTAVFLERGRIRFSGPAAELRDRKDLLRAVFLAGVSDP